MHLDRAGNSESLKLHSNERSSGKHITANLAL